MNDKKFRNIFSTANVSTVVFAGLISAVILLLAQQMMQDSLRRLQSEQRISVLNEMSSIRAKLEGAVNNSMGLLKGAASFISYKPNASQQEFASFARTLIAEHPQIRNVGAAPDFVIRLIYPLEGNEKAIGLDYRKMPAQFDAAERAMKTRKMALSGLVNLAQGGAGFIGRVPVFIGEENSTFWGLVSGVIDVPTLYEIAGLSDENLRLKIAIQGQDARGKKGAVFYGEKTRIGDTPLSLKIKVPNAEWLLIAEPKIGWLDRHPNSSRYDLISLLFLITTLIVTLAIIYYRHEKNRSQFAIYKSEKRMGEVIWGTNVGTWEWNIQTGEMIFNERWAEIVGHSLEELSPISIETWQGLVHPDDLKQSGELLEKNFSGELANYECEVRMRHKNGAWVSVLIRGKVVEWTKDGKPWRMSGTHADITKRKNAEKALEESENRYRRLVEQTQTEYFIYSHGADGVFTYVSPSVQTVLGYKPDEFCVHFTTYLTDNPINKKAEALTELSIQGEKRSTYELEIYHKNGDTRILEVSEVPATYTQGKVLAVEGIAHDITERKRMEEELRKLYQAVEQSPATIIITDTDGKIEYVNPIFEETTGYSIEEVIGKNPRIFKSGHTKAEDYGDLWSTILSGKIWRGEFLNKRKNGTLHWEAASISPMRNPDGSISKFIAVKENITKQKEAEEALKHQTEELERNLVELNASRSDLELQASELAALAENKAELIEKLKYESDVKDRFFSIISHDLKSPFTSLLGMTYMMAQMADSLSKEKLVEYAENVNDAGNRVFDLLQNLLEWSRLQMEGAQLEPEAIFLEELVQECIDILEPIAQEKNITLVNGIVNVSAFADRNMVLTVIRNLIANSLKFTPSGGSVEVTSCDLKGMVQITVSDTGVGMSAGQVEKVFSLDQKTSTTGTAGEKGTGLGLPLCKDMLERHGGRIWIESTPGDGSKFLFTLPIMT
ncbi:MAG: PAS domain S-box protein [Magnetovibrio sp.]|nr:PAS domain S-box protein [Magnetovibrio sp.]